MTVRHCAAAVAAALLAACSANDTDIRQELQAMTANASAQVAPLPPLPAAPKRDAARFEAYDLPDPFQPTGATPKGSGIRKP